MEHAVPAEAAIGQRLRVILERVRWGFRARVVDRNILIFLHQHKLHVSSDALDRSRLHVARYPQTLGIRAIAHLVQFFDSDVIALAVLHSRVSQIGQQQQNRHGGPTELDIGFQLTRHGKPQRKIYLLTVRDLHGQIKVPEGPADTDLLPGKVYTLFASIIQVTRGLPRRRVDLGGERIHV